MPSLATNISIKPKRPQMGRIKSWSAGLTGKLPGGGGGSSNGIDAGVKQEIFGEIELRNKGNSNLYAATEAYWSYLGKKKPAPFDTSSIPADDSASMTSSATPKPEGKMLPVEALGLAMTSFASAFPETSTYGTCLGLLGEAHLQLGSLQASFAKDTSHIFLARIARSKAALEAFNGAMKKLDTATSRLESAQTRVQKSKKEKRDLEEELRLAKAAYDEAVSDVEARAEAIQDSEADDWECLTTYMQAQLDYMGQAQAVLEQVKSMWGAMPPSGHRSGSSTPSSRPRSLSAAKPRPPALPRRTSAKEAGDVATSSRFTSRSSLSLANSETKDEQSSGTVNGDSKKEREKKNRLRMPSFSGTSEAVSSMASGLGSLGRARGSGLFNSSSSNSIANDTSSPEKDREGSKWNFMSRSKREPGFMSMKDSDRLHYDEPVALNGHGDSELYMSSRQGPQPSISSHDVDLGMHDQQVNRSTSRPYVSGGGNGYHSSDDESHDEDGTISANRRRDGPSPFSPDLVPNGSFLTAANTIPAHETIHERGESQLSTEMPMTDSNYLGVSAAPHHGSLGMQHTGLSAYSDNADPFASSALSPQTTGHFGASEPSSDDEDGYENAALTGTHDIAGNGAYSTGRQRSVSNGANGIVSSLGRKLGRSDNGSNASSSGFSGSSRGPPPPVPSSAAFLSKNKGRLPPPPPLPVRNN
ncbi:hypothetical protein BCV70DRAFT_205308 [Testicularia cyperi]|uniref:BAR domain-containing protein n=1 Tax=Testicularia cyperi TaxID=1882483 RepID=A0A317XT65_9BASI|nr:hypothetical protein BCV70DRAFT_205308 [Testicularia cyperi]